MRTVQKSLSFFLFGQVELQLAKLRKLSSITKMDSRGYNSTYETLRGYSLYRAKV
jgi:hypothetical protein